MKASDWRFTPSGHAQIAKLALLLCLGCASSAGDSIRQADTAAANLLSDTVPAFLAWDKAHQLEIANQHKGDVAVGEKALSDYRAKRAEIVTTMKALQKLTVAADVFASMVDQGMKGSTDVKAFLSNLLSLMQHLAEMLEAVGFPMGGL